MTRCQLLAALDPQTMLVVGVLMIGLVLVRFLLKSKRGPRAYQSPISRKGAAGHMLDAPEDVGRWEVQMHDTARNLMGELNTKIAIVEQLVRDAGAAAERLEKAIAESKRNDV